MLQCNGIVLRTIKYGETSVISDIFTEEKGLLTFIGGSVRTARARMPFNLFQAMTVVDLVAYYKENHQGMHRLKELRAAEIYQSIPFDVRRGAVALFMAEVCRKCIHEGETNPELFAFIREYLLTLDRTSEPIANLHLHFLVHLGTHLGFQPEDRTENNTFLDLKEGAYVLQKPPGPHLDLEESRQFAFFQEIDVSACHQLKLSQKERKDLLLGLLRFYQLHVPGFEGVNTPEVLNMVLG
jgi:DNA repair protein RecO (recombination protein O)